MIDEAMYKVVLAERDYERAVNEKLRKKVEELEALVDALWERLDI
jgi:hypothetical protein